MAQDNNTSQLPEGKLYKSTLKLLWPVAIAGFVSSVFLIIEGLGGLRMYPAAGEDPFRFISGYLPIIIGVFIFIGLSYLLFRNYNRRIGINAKYFLYRRGKAPIKKLSWDKISIQVPYSNKPNIFSVASVTDGHTTISIEKYFFPDFSEICSEMKEARSAFKNRDLSQ